MPEKKTIERARQDARQGKAPSTQAGEFVREEMDHIREGKARRTLRKAGDRDWTIQSAPGRCETSATEGRQDFRTHPQTGRARFAKGQSSQRNRKPSAKRSRAITNALKREPHTAASRQALSRHARSAAAQRKRAG